MYIKVNYYYRETKKSLVSMSENNLVQSALPRNIMYFQCKSM